MRVKLPLLSALVAVVAVALPAAGQQHSNIPLPVIPARPTPVEPVQVPQNPIQPFTISPITIDPIDATVYQGTPIQIAPIYTERSQIAPVEMPNIPLRPATPAFGYTSGAALSDVFSDAELRAGDVSPADRQRIAARSYYSASGGWTVGDFFAHDWDQSAWKEARTSAPGGDRPATYEEAFPAVPVRGAADREARAQKAADLGRLGVQVDWRRHSFEDLVDYEARANKARALRSLGVEVDWRRHQYWELFEMEQRARAGREKR
jgi:hypothetical protein